MQGVYEIYCQITHQRYIGSSKDISARWQQHFSELESNTHHNFFLQRAWNLYGRDNFVFSFLQEVEKEEDLYKVEEIFIKKYNFNSLFNIMKKPGASPQSSGFWTKKRRENKKKKENESYDWGV